MARPALALQRSSHRLAHRLHSTHVAAGRAYYRPAGSDVCGN